MSDSKTPEILYHYCSVDAFQNIILSKTLWLSDLSKSNDSKEGILAIERVSKWLKEKHNCSTKKCDFFRELYEKFASGIICLGTSFSEHEDRLSQWRGYGDDGKGVAIGFSPKWLKELYCCPLNSPQITASLIPIFYKESDQHNWIEKHLPDIAGNLANDMDNYNQRATRAYATIYTVGSEILYQFKDEFFGEEGEWRARYNCRESDDIELLHRSANGQIIPYVELPLHATESIKEIWLGPKNTVPDDFIRGLLAKNGFDSETDIHRSKGSYQ